MAFHKPTASATVPAAPAFSSTWIQQESKHA
jgi:hypothetical protein